MFPIFQRTSFWDTSLSGISFCFLGPWASNEEGWRAKKAGGNGIERDKSISSDSVSIIIDNHFHVCDRSRRNFKETRERPSQKSSLLFAVSHQCRCKIAPCRWQTLCLAMKVSLTRNRKSFVLETILVEVVREEERSILWREQTLWHVAHSLPSSFSLLFGYATLSTTIVGEYYSLHMDSRLRRCPPLPGAMAPWKNLMTALFV